MAVITKYHLTEQVKRLLQSGDPSVGGRIQNGEIKAAIGQVINAMLKAEHFSMMLPTGETIAEGSMLATYDNIPVVTYKDVSKSVLPVMPIKLFRNMGIFHIGKTDDTSSGFIPIQPGQFAFIKPQRLISDLIGQIGYEVNGTEIIYTSDLTAGSPAISHVMMKLVINDINQFTDYQMLPITADMQYAVIKEVYALFSSEKEPDRIVDSSAENK